MILSDRLWLKLLKAIGMLTVVVIAVTAGIASGWLQATAASLGNKHPAQVRAAIKELIPPLPGQAVNIAVLGSDHTGNSDSLMVVRLDPKTKSISMLSIPRDFWVQVPGHGMSKINAAYSEGGPALSVLTLRQVLGLPINHFIHIDFGGFADVVNLLGGVYLQIDHRYYHPFQNDYQPIDLYPGYQLLNGDSALRFVRFRHDQYYDFGRIQRQQLFLRELQRQAARWRDWAHLPRLLKAITKHTDSDISSLRQLLSLASLVLQLNTSHIYMTHIVGATPTIAGQSVVVPSALQLRTAIAQFLHPKEAPAVAVVRPQSGATTSPAPAQSNSSGSGGTTGASGAAGGSGGATTGATGSSVPLYRTAYDVTQWRRLARIAHMPLLMPGAWASGFTYDSVMPFRAYSVDTGHGHLMPAMVAVARAPASVDPNQGAFDIQEIHWTRAPILRDPTRAVVVGGRQYMLYFSGDKLTQVVWSVGPNAYWVTNTIDNVLPNSFLLSLATSFVPVR